MIAQNHKTIRQQTRRPLLTLPIYLLLLILLLPAPLPVQAQLESTCANGGRIRNDTRRPLDIDRICQAAQPWADKGIRVFVYLTDFQPETEAAWFDHLDQVEVEAGLISADLTVDDFDPQALVLEATLAANSRFGVSISNGEALFGSPLDPQDGDASALEPIKRALADNLQRENSTDAFVIALEESYALTYPPTPWAVILPVGAGLLVVLGLAVVLYFNQGRIRTAVYARRQNRRLKSHAGELKERLNNLLTLLDQLLASETPQESLLYRLFAAYDGAQYPSLEETAVAQIRQGQTLLRQAFNQWQQLEKAAPEPVESQVAQLEKLYLKLVGTGPRSQDLTDETIRDLLLPPDNEPFAGDESLVQAVEQLRQAAAAPLATYTTTDEGESAEATAVLDTIDDVKALLNRLVQAEDEAPQQLQMIAQEIQQLAQKQPDTLPFNADQLLAGLKKQHADTTALLTDKRYLAVLDQAPALSAGLAVVDQFLTAYEQHEARHQALAPLLDAGYRSAQYALRDNELADDLQTIGQHLAAAEFDEAIPIIEAFELDSLFAEEALTRWQQLHKNNQSRLEALRDEVARLEQALQEEGRPAWQQLQSFAPGNWQPLADYLSEAVRLLREMRAGQLAQIDSLNSLAEQQFEAAAAALGLAEAATAQVNHRLTAVTQRLKELNTASKTLAAALNLTEADIRRAADLRDAEDPKIDAKVDAKIEEARRAMDQARQLEKAGEYLAALQAQTRARQQAVRALASASEQVEKVDKLLSQLDTLQTDVDRQAEQQLAEAEQMPVVMQTPEVGAQAKELEAQWSLAQIMLRQTADQEDHAWSAALEQAIVAYQVAQRAASQAQMAIQIARDAYHRLTQKTEQAITQAKKAIDSAHNAQRRAGAGGAGHQALQKAQAALPNKVSLDGATRERLEQLIRQAGQAREFAELAARQANQAADRHAAQQQRRQRSNSTWSGWNSGASSLRTSSRSSSRSSSSSRARSSSSRARSSGSRRSSGSTRSRHRH